MKVVIFGAAGQLGQALAASAPAGAELVGLDLPECDIGDPGQVEAAVTAAMPAIVFNAAAYTAVDRAESEPNLAHRLNADAAGWIAAAAREVGARMVQVSTDFVFGGAAAAPRAPGDPVDPQGVYARTKHAGEQAVAAACPDALIVRTAWLYAARGANFVNTMLRLMAERDEVRVVADQIGTPTWAPSLARALWALAEAGARGVHHYTDAGVASWYDFAVAIEEESRAAGLRERPVRMVPINTADYPVPAPRPAYSVLDKSATWALLGGPAPHWRANLRENMRELRDL
ncbi:MAG TPA: dTDP-4-dehydrorhamnose reductase [Allosphingosinicella sp.]|nr:dTDP-4-dehydrorhamnose reductase [Allosphingosinicella sp.]